MDDARSRDRDVDVDGFKDKVTVPWLRGRRVR